MHTKPRNLDRIRSAGKQVSKYFIRCRHCFKCRFSGKHLLDRFRYAVFIPYLSITELWGGGNWHSHPIKSVKSTNGSMLYIKVYILYSKLK